MRIRNKGVHIRPVMVMVDGSNKDKSFYPECHHMILKVRKSAMVVVVYLRE